MIKQSEKVRTLTLTCKFQKLGHLSFHISYLFVPKFESCLRYILFGQSHCEKQEPIFANLRILQSVLDSV